ncbi:MULTISPECIES: hypothetical protein [Micrococcaceae]|uniref:hypothetical protein n=1 Tax=Micrococcaceae TaxID=1268 RepID=UPI0012FC1D5E|nr:hypothetical protein [Pseudarthrobacter sp. GA104]MUU71480.1 hypothetical protein [Pseudarthrobacter sp. GA104]
MKSYRCDDWGRFVGAEVEIRRRGRLVRAGVVDAVAADVAMLWLAADGAESRRIFEAAEGFEVWADSHDLPDRRRPAAISQQATMPAPEAARTKCPSR